MSLRNKNWCPIGADGRLIVPKECPKWIRSVNRVRVVGDIFSLSPREIDYICAVFASNGTIKFEVDGDPSAYLSRVAKLSVGAAQRYEKKLRAHFNKYKKQFIEGYSLPGKPTPELRFIYDSAAAIEKRPENPCGTTVRSGFSGGEYHWRSWPLGNVAYVQRPAG